MNAPALRDWFLRRALWLGVLWGFAEGTLFFIVPDVIITLIALFSFRGSVRCMLAVLLGALIGGTLLYVLAAADPDQIIATVNGVPFVTDPMFGAAQDKYRQYGAWGILAGPASGIPFKVYAVLAPEYISFWSFLLASIPARLGRFIITGAAFAAIGFAVRHRSQDCVGRLFIGHGLFWSAVCFYYWAVVVNRSGEP